MKGFLRKVWEHIKASVRGWVEGIRLFPSVWKQWPNWKRIVFITGVYLAGLLFVYKVSIYDPDAITDLQSVKKIIHEADAKTQFEYLQKIVSNESFKLKVLNGVITYDVTPIYTDQRDKYPNGIYGDIVGNGNIALLISDSTYCEYDSDRGIFVEHKLENGLKFDPGQGIIRPVMRINEQHYNRLEDRVRVAGRRLGQEVEVEIFKNEYKVKGISSGVMPGYGSFGDISFFSFSSKVTIRQIPDSLFIMRQPFCENCEGVETKHITIEGRLMAWNSFLGVIYLPSDSNSYLIDWNGATRQSLPEAINSFIEDTNLVMLMNKGGVTPFLFCIEKENADTSLEFRAYDFFTPSSYFVDTIKGVIKSRYNDGWLTTTQNENILLRKGDSNTWQILNVSKQSEGVQYKLQNVLLQDWQIVYDVLDYKDYNLVITTEPNYRTELAPYYCTLINKDSAYCVSDSVNIFTGFPVQEQHMPPFIDKENLHFLVNIGDLCLYDFVFPIQMFKGQHTSQSVLNPVVNKVTNNVHWPLFAPFVVKKQINIFIATALISFVIVIYCLILILATSKNTSRTHQYNSEILEQLPALELGIREIETITANLKARKEIMLWLGVTFGVGGVVAFFISLQYSVDQTVITGWNAPTVFALLRPAVMLVFIETFTFFFLKQYRITFNEYKLFYSVYLKLLSYCQTLELVKDDEESLKEAKKELSKVLLNKEWNLYETGTKTSINEFDNSSLIKLLDKMNDIEKKIK